jgi:hypothetical protein
MIDNIGMPSSAKALLAIFEFDKQPATRYTRMILVVNHDDNYIVSAQYGDRAITAADELKDVVDGRHRDVKWDRSWAQGHYFEQDLVAARKYFLKRCAEGR